MKPDITPQKSANLRAVVQARVLGAITAVLVSVGDADLARDLIFQTEIAIRNITSSYRRTDPLIAVAKALLIAGHRREAGHILRKAVAFLPSSAAYEFEIREFADIVEVLVTTGDDGLACHVAARAEAAARGIDHPSERGKGLQTAAEALAKIGEISQAQATARAIIDQSGQARALAAVAKILVTTGDHGQAGEVARQAEAAAREVTNPGARAAALAAAAKALARVGDTDQAEIAARAISDPDAQAEALQTLVGALETARRHSGAEDEPGAMMSLSETMVMRAASQAATERSRQLLALALAQAKEYMNLLPLLATIEPIAVIKASRYLSSVHTAITGS